VLVVVGLVVLGAGMVAVGDGTVSDGEEAVFHAINDLPDVLYPVLWPFQQLGVLVVGPIAAVVALLFRRYHLAVALLLATALKLVSERMVKAHVTRLRPETSIEADIHRRGDVNTSGESFVSGHALLVTALATVIAPYLRGRWRIVPWVCVGTVLLARVYVGAHNPLDVICGGALGLAVGGVLNLLFGVPRDVKIDASPSG
jgi:undecaprenyl-diphosphatase